MNRIILLLFFFFLSVFINADNEVNNTNQGIANASPGDYIIRSNGQRVVLSQADIDYARNQLGINTGLNNQDIPSPLYSASSTNYISLWLEKIRFFLKEVCNFFGSQIQQITGFFNIMPSFARAVSIILLFFAAFGILTSHILGICRHRLEWKPKQGSNLMFSYFCGSGQFQRKKIYQEANKLLRDEKWSLISVAGLAYRFGNFTHPSKVLMFACSLLYFPLAILGIIEMAMRIIIGTVWLLSASFAHLIMLFLLQCVSYITIPLWQIVDKAMRVEQHCSNCYNKFDLPEFKCPHCGTIHKQLIPSHCGILIARCKCGCFIPSSAFTGRSLLVAMCPNTKCSCELAAANAKQLSILLVGGNASGKTAFLAAFQHLYLYNKFKIKNSSIHGEPYSNFVKLDEMYTNGTTEYSSGNKVFAYNFIHKIRHNVKHNLIIYDIPDEGILSGAYERNPVNYRYSDGIIIMVDPLSISLIREKCLKDGDIKAIENYSQDSISTLIVQFIHQFSDIVGRSAKKMHNIPVAVLISKADIKVVMREVGLPQIKAKFKASPDSYGNNMNIARNEICKEFLHNSGLANAMNNLESVFSNIAYFPVSAIGHLSKTGKTFEPFGILEPVTWIAQNNKAAIKPLLKANL